MNIAPARRAHQHEPVLEERHLVLGRHSAPGLQVGFRTRELDQPVRRQLRVTRIQVARDLQAEALRVRIVLEVEGHEAHAVVGFAVARQRGEVVLQATESIRRRVALQEAVLLHVPIAEVNR